MQDQDLALTVLDVPYSLDNGNSKGLPRHLEHHDGSGRREREREGTLVRARKEVMSGAMPASAIIAR